MPDYDALSYNDLCDLRCFHIFKWLKITQIILYSNIQYTKASFFKHGNIARLYHSLKLDWIYSLKLDDRKIVPSASRLI